MRTVDWVEVTVAGMTDAKVVGKLEVQTVDLVAVVCKLVVLTKD